VASGSVPLAAVNISAYGELICVFAPGVPASVPVPLVLSVKVTPLGSAPLRVIAGVGVPVVVTVNVFEVPTVNVVVLADVIAGATGGGFSKLSAKMRSGRSARSLG